MSISTLKRKKSFLWLFMYGQSKIGLVYKERKEEEIAFVVPLLHAWDSLGVFPRLSDMILIINT